MYFAHYQSPLGEMTMESNGVALTGLWFHSWRYAPHAVERGENPALPIFQETAGWLDQYFRGEIPDFMPKLAPVGTVFREKVWAQLAQIPWGQTVTYGQIAQQLASQRGIPHMSAQAVGGAVGHNPIAILLPCHRVVGTDGSLTGYAGGLERKEALLALEGWQSPLK